MNNLDNNIAALKFDQNLLEFGARPICLWNQDLQNNAGAGIAQNNGIGTVYDLVKIQQSCVTVQF
jgi:hypothetical protein